MKSRTLEKKCQNIDNHIRGTRSSETWKTIKAKQIKIRQNVIVNRIPEKTCTEYFEDLQTERRRKFLPSNKQAEVTERVKILKAEIEEAIKMKLKKITKTD